MSRFDFFPPFFAHLHNTFSSRRPQFNDGKSKILSLKVCRTLKRVDDATTL